MGSVVDIHRAKLKFISVILNLGFLENVAEQHDKHIPKLLVVIVIKLMKNVIKIFLI